MIFSNCLNNSTSPPPPHHHPDAPSAASTVPYSPGSWPKALFSNLSSVRFPHFGAIIFSFPYHFSSTTTLITKQPPASQSPPPSHTATLQAIPRALCLRSLFTSRSRSALKRQGQPAVFTTGLLCCWDCLRLACSRLPGQAAHHGPHIELCCYWLFKIQVRVQTSHHKY